LILSEAHQLDSPASPDHVTREGRIRILARWSEAILGGRQPDPADAIFVASGINAWLQEGGSIARQFWRTSAPQGSNLTETMVWWNLRREALRASEKRFGEARQVRARRVTMQASEKPEPGK